MWKKYGVSGKKIAKIDRAELAEATLIFDKKVRDHKQIACLGQGMSTCIVGSQNFWHLMNAAPIITWINAIGLHKANKVCGRNTTTNGPCTMLYPI